MARLLPPLVVVDPEKHPLVEVFHIARAWHLQTDIPSEADQIKRKVVETELEATSFSSSKNQRRHNSVLLLLERLGAYVSVLWFDQVLTVMIRGRDQFRSSQAY